MSAVNQLLRYTGPRPFTIRDRDRFFGRDQDIEALGRTIRLNRLTVLSGKSGMGKSSLLQAGVIPELSERNFHPVTVRFEAWDHGKPTPVQRLADALASLPGSVHPLLDQVAGGDPSSLWQCCKALTNANPEGERMSLLLIFDQFEELFTYPDDEIDAFADALAHAVMNEIPESFRNRFREARRHRTLSEADIAFIQAEIPLHVVFSIRSDRMDRLTRLTDYLPGVLRNCYDLGALTEEGARAAIVKTARAEGAFASPPFRYTPAALDLIVSELTRPDERGRAREIQSFLLQIICQYAEERVVIGTGAKEVKPEDLGDISDIIGAFYAFQMDKISADPEQLGRAREFVEEGLIFDGIRMTLNEEYAIGKYKLSQGTLLALENTHLIRAELADGGRRTYELSHDTLVAPITRARDARVAEAVRQHLEAEAEAARLKAEAETQRAQELEALKNNAVAASRRARIFSLVAGVVALVAVLAALWATKAQLKAKAATQTAQTQREEALREKRRSDSLRRFSEQMLQEIRRQKSMLSEEQEKTLGALGEAREKEALRLAEEKRRKAVERESVENELEDLKEEVVFLQRVGQTEEARQIVIEALKQAPENQTLRSLLQQLK